MRSFYLVAIILLATAIVIFAGQNFQSITVFFFRISAQTPLAFLIVAIYLLGTATGGSLLALLRRSLEGARPRTTLSP